MTYFDSIEECCNKFTDGFIFKIKTLIDQREYVYITITESVSYKETLDGFRTCDINEVSHILKETKKTCVLDPLPSCVFTLCIDVLTPIVTNIINASIIQAHVPLSMKAAIIRLLLKKSSLDVDILSSYRPGSNLTQVYKCLEKVIAQQLIEHTSEMTELYQSFYESNHSTETALIAVCDDIKRGFDNRKGTALIMIDLSAAVDTISHSILLQRLRNRYGITHNALKWFHSFLSERYQYISISDHQSYSFKLTTGVLQGSVLGPLLFSLYVQPIGDIIRKHGLSFHPYAIVRPLHI